MSGLRDELHRLDDGVHVPPTQAAEGAWSPNCDPGGALRAARLPPRNRAALTIASCRKRYGF